MFMTRRDCLIALSSFQIFGNQRLNSLLSYFVNPQKVWRLKINDLTEVGINQTVAERFIFLREKFNKTAYFDQLKRYAIKVMVKGDTNYPINLVDLTDASLVLYYQGQLKAVDEKSLAVVGSRQMTVYGKRVCQQLVGDLVKEGVTIVSGLARGVDTVTHLTALTGKGRTIAVLGCGLDDLYPPENLALAKKIIKNGALLSKYSVKVPIRPSNFVAKNRIVSGLAKGVLVVEGAEKSGTLTTAAFAADQGREVFAAPGPVDSPLSWAPHFLLRNGATLASCAKDITDNLFGG